MPRWQLLFLPRHESVGTLWLTERAGDLRENCGRPPAAAAGTADHREQAAQWWQRAAPPAPGQQAGPHESKGMASVSALRRRSVLGAGLLCAREGRELSDGDADIELWAANTHLYLSIFASMVAWSRGGGRFRCTPRPSWLRRGAWPGRSLWVAIFYIFIVLSTIFRVRTAVRAARPALSRSVGSRQVRPE